MKVSKGDWIRFYNGGKIVIGQVEYVRKCTIHDEACSDAGVCDLESILEVRKAPTKEEGR